VSVAPIENYDGLESLPITINALEYVGGEWVSLAGQKTIHLLITVV
jgi:hypothetical protein